jgi:hypothetical protein
LLWRKGISNFGVIGDPDDLDLVLVVGDEGEMSEAKSTFPVGARVEGFVKKTS